MSDVSASADGPISVQMPDMFKVGGHDVAVPDAREWVREYLNGDRGQFGYPSYDGYRTNDDPNHLCEGDLLAPMLLNVQIKIRSFGDLCARRDELDRALSDVPIDVDLAVASTAAMATVGGLFEILDRDPSPRHVKGTTLAKVLHRKRPKLVPLYDEYVRRVYQDGVGAPLPPVSGRTWAEFMTLLAGSMRVDLNRAPDLWDEFRTLAPADGPKVSRLRVLDIVAWRLGQLRGHVDAGQGRSDRSRRLAKARPD